MAGEEGSIERCNGVTAADQEAAANYATAEATTTTVAAGGEVKPSASATEWVEMPEAHIRWILAQERDTDPVPNPDDYPESLEGYSPEAMAERRRMYAVTCANIKAEHDDFFEYQAWIRETYDKNGCVMVPAHAAPPKPGMKEAIEKLWAECVEEYRREHPESSIFDGECEALEEALPSN